MYIYFDNDKWKIMANPRTLIKTLYDYYELIERLAIKSRVSGSMDRQDILLEARTYFKQDYIKASETIQQLERSGILRSIDQDNAFIIQKTTKDFVLALAKEQKLGLADIVRVEIEQVQKLSQDIQIALEKQDLPILQSKASQIMDQMEEIQSHLESDRNAIKNIIERAKSFPADTPLNVRYGEVGECYDHYVEPMTQLLGNDSSGFLNLTLDVEAQLEEGIRLCSILTGTQASWPRSMKNAQKQIRMLRTLIASNLALFQNELAPLRNTLIKNNSISRSVVALLGKIRKKGLRRSINTKNLMIGGGQRGARLSLGPSIRNFAAEVLKYSPSKEIFPDSPEIPEEKLNLLRIETVLHDLEKAHKGVSLLQWIKDTYPQYDERTWLGVYQQLLQLSSNNFKQCDSEEILNLKEHRVTYFPHVLEN